MNSKHVVLAIALGLGIVSCESDDAPPILPSGDYEDGILVSNEGPFNNGTGTVSFISSDLQVVENSVYNNVNNEDLGNIVQSIGFTNEKAFIVANNSNKIVIVDRYTFEKEIEITDGLNNPRYFVAANGKGYVTNWGDPNDETDDYLAIIDLSSSTVSGTVPLDFGPEEILVASEDQLYVAHQGGFGQNNTITVFNTVLDEVTNTIEVGDVPNAMQLDGLGNLWVLCGGKPAFTGEETAGSLIKITLIADRVDSRIDFLQTEHPNHLSFDGNNLYYSLNGAIYKMPVMAAELPTIPEFEELSTYAMAIDADKLYVTDAKDFASNGSLSIYDLSTKEKVNTFEVGIIPGGIYFN